MHLIPCVAASATVILYVLYAKRNPDRSKNSNCLLAMSAPNFSTRSPTHARDPLKRLIKSDNRLWSHSKDLSTHTRIHERLVSFGTRCVIICCCLLEHVMRMPNQSPSHRFDKVQSPMDVLSLFFGPDSSLRPCQLVTSCVRYVG